jgi:hypothetical protein
MKMFRSAILGIVFTTSGVGIAGASGQATQTTGIQAQPPSKNTRASNGAAPADKTDASAASKSGDASANVQATTGDPAASDKQKKLAADTDKLLAMATDLKQQVDKTNKDVLSVDVIKKAEEIEKLARSLKNEMKQ